MDSEAWARTSFAPGARELGDGAKGGAGGSDPGIRPLDKSIEDLLPAMICEPVINIVLLHRS